MVWYKEDLYMDEIRANTLLDEIRAIPIGIRVDIYMNEIRAKTIKLLENNIGENFYDLGLGKDFFR